MGGVIGQYTKQPATPRPGVEFEVLLAIGLVP